MEVVNFGRLGIVRTLVTCFIIEGRGSIFVAKVTHFTGGVTAHCERGKYVGGTEFG